MAIRIETASEAGGGGSGGRFTETFTATSTKTVTHNLGNYPVVHVRLASTREIIVEVTHTSVNALVLDFSGTLTAAIVVCNVSA